MRRSIFALGFVCLLLNGLSVNAQSESNNTNPFAKRTWNFPLRNTFVGTRFNSYFQDVNTDRVTTLSTNFEAMYFPVNNLGIGVTYLSNYTWDLSDIQRDWLLSLALKYGFHLSSSFNLYLRASAGIGKETYLNRIPGDNNNYEFKNSNSGFSVELGAPIKLNTSATAFISPFVTYRSLKKNAKNSDFETTDNSVLFGLKLEAYINKASSVWGFKEGYALSKTRYAQGRSFLGFSNQGYYESGKTKHSGGGFIGEPKFDLSSSQVGLNYNYYFINNLAIGADFSYNQEKREDGSLISKIHTWSVGPQLTFNLPVKSNLNNLYLQADGHIGKQRLESTNGPFDFVDKYKTKDVSFGIGYTNFISRNIAFSPVLAYRWNKFTQESTDMETTSRGLVLRTGLKLFF